MIEHGRTGFLCEDETDMAEFIVGSGQADLVFIGRAMLGDPYWPMHAAKSLRTGIAWPWQYERGDIY